MGRESNPEVPEQERMELRLTCQVAQGWALETKQRTKLLVPALEGLRAQKEAKQTPNQEITMQGDEDYAKESPGGLKEHRGAPSSPGRRGCGSSPHC